MSKIQALFNYIPKQYFVEDLKDNRIGHIKLALVRETINPLILKLPYFLRCLITAVSQAVVASSAILWQLVLAQVVRANSFSELEFDT